MHHGDATDYRAAQMMIDAFELEDRAMANVWPVGLTLFGWAVAAAMVGYLGALYAGARVLDWGCVVMGKMTVDELKDLLGKVTPGPLLNDSFAMQGDHDTHCVSRSVWRSGRNRGRGVPKAE